jgi:hypothetical protein
MITNGGAGGPIAELVEHWSMAAQAYLNGDLPTYAGLANHAADYTLTPPCGGDPRRGFDGSDGVTCVASPVTLSNRCA